MTTMGFFRQYIAPLFIVLIFAVALLAVSARIFLPSDMMAPAPIEEPVLALPMSFLTDTVLSSASVIG
jgi:hypothetical protein